MPRKPSSRTEKFTLMVNGEPIEITLYSPRGNKKTWYVLWKGLASARSTGQTSFDEARKFAEAMFRNGGRRPEARDAVLTDADFRRIQKRHFGKNLDSIGGERANKSLTSCLEAIEAFKRVTSLEFVTSATPHDCENFQHAALKLKSNWRRKKKRHSDAGNQGHAVDQEDHSTLSPSTIVKWSTALQAAFERANKNAGKKCVRGVVSNERLLDENPWRQFTWIKPLKREIRHFDINELTSLLDWCKEHWQGITVAPLYFKVMLWSWARRSEVSQLKWSDERKVLSECHFKSVGKHGVEKWFRLPLLLRNELEAIRCESEFVFGGYSSQLHNFYVRKGNRKAATRVRKEFDPKNLGEWMYHRVKEWSVNSPAGTAYLHIFRKTGLQFALAGEHAMIEVARDASITPQVMAASYAQELREQLRQKSNRTFYRIRNSLPMDVAARYGYETSERESLIEAIDAARMEHNWQVVQNLVVELVQLDSNGVL